MHSITRSESPPGRSDDDNSLFALTWAKGGNIWTNQFIYSAVAPPSIAGVSCSPATTNLALGPTAQFGMPLPESLAPITAYFQGYHTNAAGDRLLSTPALVVPLTK